MSLFQAGFERRKCHSASLETSVRRERPVKEEKEKEEFEEEGSEEDGEKVLAAKRRKVPKSQYYVYTYTRITCRYGLDKPIKQ